MARVGGRGGKLWRISLKPDLTSISPLPDDDPQQEATLDTFSVYDLSSAEALVIYFHAAAGYPVRSTWLRAIEAGNFASFPGLTLANAKRFCPSANETIESHLVQERQGTRSSCAKPQEASNPSLAADADGIHDQFSGAGYGAKQPATPPQDETAPAPASSAANELHVCILHHSKLYTDDIGRFPFQARSGNQHGMVAYHSSNVILFKPFKSRKDTH